MQKIWGTVMRWGSNISAAEICDYGDVMTMNDFIDCCRSGGFIDYDGYGHYSDGLSEFDDEIKPSDVRRGIVKNYSHVVWYNR